MPEGIPFVNTSSIKLGFSVLFAVAFILPPVLSSQVPSPAAADSNSTKLDDITKETQKSVGGSGATGLIWWIPTEFWEESAIQEGTTPEKARQTFAPMREYTTVLIAVGKIGIGNINWYSESELRSNTTLRDVEGTTYKPLTEISADARGIASVVKPVLTNILGPMGQNLQIMFFPAKTAKGAFIADPVREGSFSLTVAEPSGQGQFVFEWLLPLTSLSPPKFCPIGKERVEANWKYCPWHGVKLPGNIPAAIPLVELKPKNDKSQ
jgi:hypothetical protein